MDSLPKTTASELITYDQYKNILESQIRDVENAVQKYKSRTRDRIDLSTERVKLPEKYQNFIDAKPDLTAVLEAIEKQMKCMKFHIEAKNRQLEYMFPK